MKFQKNATGSEKFSRINSGRFIKFVRKKEILKALASFEPSLKMGNCYSV